MCKRTKHLSIQDDCWIFRIQAEDFTRGGDKFRVVELWLSYVYKALYLAAKFITFPGKIQNLAAKLSNIATHKIGRNSILN